MADFPERFSEVHNPLITENNASLAAGTYDSPWVALTNYHRGVLILNVVDMGAGATLDVSLRQATTTAGAGAKAITGKAFTQLTQAGGDADSDCCMELRTEELDVTGLFDCVGVRSVVANAAVVIAYRFYGRVPRYPPAGTSNWTEVIA
jgi:hypothetical protein